MRFTDKVITAPIAADQRKNNEVDNMNKSNWKQLGLLLRQSLRCFHEIQTVFIYIFIAHSFNIGLPNKALASTSFLNSSFGGSHFNGRFTW